jgi:FkbM family methyltransferase
MKQNTPANPELLSKFTYWWHQNRKGGWICTWRRRHTWLAQLIQKLGWHQEVFAPLFWGDRMQVITGETVSRGILTFGYSESAITALMLCLIGSEQTVVDIGTHFGYEALLASKLVGLNGCVICFEPNSSAFNIAQKNLTRFPQTQLYQKAIAERVGKLHLNNLPIWQSAFNSISNSSSETTDIEVPAISLDVVLANRTRPVDFLKCDVEGYEMSVLKGAHNILCQDQPILVLEADMPSPEGKNSARAYELATYLKRYDYQAFNFDFNGALRFGLLDTFPVFHANVAFIPVTRIDVMKQLSKV